MTEEIIKREKMIRVQEPYVEVRRQLTWNRLIENRAQHTYIILASSSENWIFIARPIKF